MNQVPISFKVRFLVSTKSWDEVKKVFKNDLGITKDKKDDSVVPIRDHFVVEVTLPETELSDDFYEKVAKSKHITILLDESSQERSKEVLTHIAAVELKLRELAVYAYDLAATYKDIMNIKHKDAKSLVSKNQLVDENVIDPLVAFFDFGELIEFLNKTGNLVDETNIADDTARLMELSTNFDDFKRKYAQKFKKLTVWEIISNAVLVSDIEWQTIKDDLDVLKGIRNTALHHRVLTPSKLNDARTITSGLMKHFKTKALKQKSTENMDAVFESWNKALTGYNSYQKAIEHILDLQTSNSFQRIISQQFDTQQTLQRAIENTTKIPDIQASALESMRRSLDSINRLGLSTWVGDSTNREESQDSQSTKEDDDPSNDKGVSDDKGNSEEMDQKK